MNIVRLIFILLVVHHLQASLPDVLEPEQQEVGRILGLMTTDELSEFAKSIKETDPYIQMVVSQFIDLRLRVQLYCPTELTNTVYEQIATDNFRSVSGLRNTYSPECFTAVKTLWLFCRKNGIITGLERKASFTSSRSSQSSSQESVIVRDDEGCDRNCMRRMITSLFKNRDAKKKSDQKQIVMNNYGRKRTSNFAISAKETNDIRILTYNIAKMEFTTPEHFQHRVTEIRADICVFQEVTQAQFIKILIPAMKKLGYPHSASCMTSRLSELNEESKKVRDRLGNVLFSRYPIMSKKEERLTEYKGILSRCAVDAVIKTPNGNLLRVIGTHLAFGKSKISKRIRSHQLKQVLSLVKWNPEFETLVVGDFNMPENEFQSEISNRLLDAFKISNSKEPKETQWRGKRIDFLLVTPNVKVRRANTWFFKDSDHLPISTDIIVN